MNNALTATLGCPEVAVHSWGQHGLNGLRNWASTTGRVAKYRRTGMWTLDALLDYCSQNGSGDEVRYYDGLCNVNGRTNDCVYSIDGVDQLLTAKDAWNRLERIIEGRKPTERGGEYIVVSGDGYSTCGSCYGAIQTEPDCFSWTPDYVVGDGDIYCGCCSRMDNAQGLFDEAEQAGEPLAVNGSGGGFCSAWAMDAKSAKEWLAGYVLETVEECDPEDVTGVGFLEFSGPFCRRDRRDSVAKDMAKEGYSVVTGEDNDSSVDPTSWLFFRKN